MKLILLTALLSAFTATASASIKCEKVSCKRDPNLVSNYDFCTDFSNFEFEQVKNTVFIITSLDKRNKKSEYFADAAASSPQKIHGNSEHLMAKFEIDAKLERGHLVMHQRGTGLVSAAFELSCVGTIF